MDHNHSKPLKYSTKNTKVLDILVIDQNSHGAKNIKNKLLD